MCVWNFMWLHFNRRHARYLGFTICHGNCRRSSSSTVTVFDSQEQIRQRSEDTHVTADLSQKVCMLGRLRNRLFYPCFHLRLPVVSSSDALLGWYIKADVSISSACFLSLCTVTASFPWWNTSPPVTVSHHLISAAALEFVALQQIQL